MEIKENKGFRKHRFASATLSITLCLFVSIAQSDDDKDHHYVLKDGFQYGYEPGTSIEDAAQGKLSNEILMFKYAGQREGKFQVFYPYSKTHVTAMECDKPCEFIKIIDVDAYNGITTSHLRATEGSIGYGVMQDAISGKLNQFILEEKGKKLSVWFDTKSGMKTIPVK